MACLGLMCVKIIVLSIVSATFSIEIMTFSIKILSFSIEIMSFFIKIMTFSIEILSFFIKIMSFSIEIMTFFIKISSFSIVFVLLFRLFWALLTSLLGLVRAIRNSWSVPSDVFSVANFVPFQLNQFFVPSHLAYWILISTVISISDSLLFRTSIV